MQIWSLLILLCCSAEPAGSEYSDDGVIWGYVVEAETGEPIEAASVYIAHTMLGSATRVDGYYAIEGLSPGTYDLIISRIGFQTRRFQVEIIRDGKPVHIDVSLDYEVYELEMVGVTAERPRGWSRRAKLFQELFLGTMPFEEEAELMNPYALDFKEDRRLLRAVAEDVLKIENRALGYTIYFQLMGFQWDKRAKILEFTGAGYYLVDDASTDREDVRANRSRIYSWLARSNPSLEGEWEARIIEGHCRCMPSNYGIMGVGTCQCTYRGLTPPSFRGSYRLEGQ